MSDVPIVHIIDEYLGTGQSLKIIVESAGLLAAVYDSAEEFLGRLNSSSPGCIILDLGNGNIDDVTLLQKLRVTQCEIPVIITSGHADVSEAIRSIKLGAIDLLQKPFEPSVLVSIVETAIQDSIKANDRRRITEAVRQRFVALTPRERDLLKLIVTGRSNKQIALELNISIRTVGNHRAHLMAKTLAANAADLARMSTIAGITSPD